MILDYAVLFEPIGRDDCSLWIGGLTRSEFSSWYGLDLIESLESIIEQSADYTNDDINSDIEFSVRQAEAVLLKEEEREGQYCRDPDGRIIPRAQVEPACYLSLVHYFDGDMLQISNEIDSNRFHSVDLNANCYVNCYVMLFRPWQDMRRKSCHEMICVPSRYLLEVFTMHLMHCAVILAPLRNQHLRTYSERKMIRYCHQNIYSHLMIHLMSSHLDEELL